MTHPSLFLRGSVFFLFAFTTLATGVPFGTFAPSVSALASVDVDLSVVKTASAIDADSEQVTYTVVVTNNGPSTANGAIQDFDFDPALTYNDTLTDVENAVDCDENMGTIECPMFTLANAESITYDFVFDLPGTLVCATEYDNSVTVESIEIDTNLANNVSSATATVVCAAICVSTDEDLEFYLALDETSGTTAFDSTANDRDGTHTNGPVISTTVPTLAFDNVRSLHFDGTNDFVDLGTGFSPVTNFTVAAWVNPDTIAIDRQVVSKGYNGTDTQWELKTTTADGRVSFRGFDNPTANGAESTSTLTASTWTHVAGSYDGTDWRIYVNGVLENTVTAPGPVATAQRLLVGAVDTTGAPVQHWDGLIDEVRAYSRVLTGDEIADLAGGQCEAVPLPVCGNSVIESGETCDDGNQTNGDGCSAICEIEDDFVCSGEPSSCAPVCNGLTATIYVQDGVIVSTNLTEDGQAYAGVLTGTNDADVIVGTSGDDTITGLNGGDTICAGDGEDDVNSGGNNDFIFGEAGNDVLRGGANTDALNGGDGYDFCVPGNTLGDSAVECESSDVQQGLVVIQKDAQPDDEQDFAFTGAASFTLDDDGGSDSTYDSIAYFSLDTGSHVFTESAVPGWTLIGLSCVDPDDGTLTDLPSATATVDLDAAEVVVCTFVNEASSSSSSSSESSESSSSSSSIAECSPSDFGLLAYLRLDETEAPVAEDTAGSNNGTWVGTPVPTSDASPTAFFNPNSLDFDGASHVTLGDVLDMGMSDYSVSTWFKTVDSDYTLFSKSFYGNQNSRFFLIDEGAGLYAAFQGTSVVETSRVTGLSDGNWHHAVVTFDRDGMMTLYVDNVAAASADISAQVAHDMQSAFHLFLGRYNDNVVGQSPHPSVLALDGQMDDVRVYNRALTTDEVGDLYAQECDAFDGSSSSSSESSESSSSSSEESSSSYSSEYSSSSESSSEGPLVCEPTDEDLIAYWQFEEEEGTSAVDSTDYNNLGELQNGALFSTEAPSVEFINAGSVLFDGSNDLVDVADVTGLDFDTSDAFSVSAWVNGSVFGGYQTIVQKIDDTQSTAQPGYVFTLSNGVPELWLLSDYQGNQYIWARANTAVIAGEWQHVAFSYDGSGTAAGVRLYIDGVDVTDAPMNDTLGANSMQNTAEFEIGNRADGTFQPFGGRIDDVRVYGRELSSGQVYDLYDGECEVTPEYSSSSSSYSSEWSSSSAPMDSDGDSIVDGVDNCTYVHNTDQSDVDTDGVGDMCDNCEFTINPDQTDSNENGTGDACEGGSSSSSSSFSSEGGEGGEDGGEGGDTGSEEFAFSGFSAPLDEDSSNGSTRGDQTHIIAHVALWLFAMNLGEDMELAPGGFGGVAPGAFGGSNDVPLTPVEIGTICGMQRALPSSPATGVLDWTAMYLAELLNRDAEFIRDWLTDDSLCDEFETAMSRSTVFAADERRKTFGQEVALKAFEVDEDGVPVSSNAIWNGCIRGEVVKDATGNPYNCERFRTADGSWVHPDHLNSFIWRGGNVGYLGLGQGYYVVHPTTVVQND